MSQSVDFIRDFRDAQRIRALARQIQKEIRHPLRVMEICGGHTHTIMRFGLPQILPPEVEFIHGPGCPVCIMPKERIDHAIALAQPENHILVTLGDMIRVPGSKSSLQKERARGRNIKPVYSPLDTLKIARQHPDKTVIYFAIGFETTTPMTASLIERILRDDIRNVVIHVNHVLVPPPIHAIMQSGDARINAFIGPSHVSVIAGAKIYDEIAKQYRTPIVVAGFEPVDIMESILMLVRQMNEGRADVEIQYKRAVTWEGNVKAQEMIRRYMEVRESFRWRGIGDIPRSALKLRPEYAHLDAEVVFKELLPTEPIDDHKVCICGQILKGLAKPFECKVFGTGCTPQHPLGSCMVSSEGACAAYYRYGQLNREPAVS